MSKQISNKNIIAHAILGNNRALGSGVCIYAYVGATPSISELSSSSDGTAGVLSQGGTYRGGGAPGPVRLQGVCGYFAVPLWQRRQLSV
jgi:hypothetical protein